MGSGSWSECSFKAYSTMSGKKMTSRGTIDVSNMSVQDNYKQHSLHKDLDPKGVMRECCDSDEHPNTLPVILALDVTGSMGGAALEVASKLHKIMDAIMQKRKDVEFMIMAIGDLIYDEAPIQASQFESDIRIAKQLDLVWFEGGGGPNEYESYTAPWYFGLHNTSLDCWKRGQKGIIITMGDEELNPILHKTPLNEALGCDEQGDVDTKKLYDKVKDKYDLYHIHVNHNTSSKQREATARNTFTEVIGEQNFFATGINGLSKIITGIITDRPEVPVEIPVADEAPLPPQPASGKIAWA